MIQKTSLTPKSSRVSYYAASLLTLATRLRPSAGALKLLVAKTVAAPVTIGFRRSAVRFLVRSRMDIWIVKEVCLDRDYERVGTPLLDGWTVMDVGAGLGEFSVEAAVRYPRSVLYAFEPSPQAYALLNENVALNRLTNVHTYPVALGSTPVHLDVSAPTTAHHRLVGPGEPARESDVSVAVQSLDDAIRACGIARCDFLKMDCEGAEFDVLLGASSETFQRIDRICLEYHDGAGRHHEALVSKLTSEGFTVRQTNSPAYEELGFLYAWRA